MIAFRRPTFSLAFLIVVMSVTGLCVVVAKNWIVASRVQQALEFYLRDTNASQDLTGSMLLRHPQTAVHQIMELVSSKGNKERRLDGSKAIETSDSNIV